LSLAVVSDIRAAEAFAFLIVEVVVPASFFALVNVNLTARTFACIRVQQKFIDGAFFDDFVVAFA
jgi:hypothetical protein